MLEEGLEYGFLQLYFRMNSQTGNLPLKSYFNVEKKVFIFLLPLPPSLSFIPSSFSFLLFLNSLWNFNPYINQQVTKYTVWGRAERQSEAEQRALVTHNKPLRRYLALLE